MAQTVVFVFFATLAAAGLFYLWNTHVSRPTLEVSIRLDRSAPGAHVLWSLANHGSTPFAFTKLCIYSKRRWHRTLDTIPFDTPKRLGADDELTLATDVDWNMLEARSLAIVDDTGHEYRVAGRQLAAIQDQLHAVIDRRPSPVSARDFLFGAGDLAAGAVILGLGFFMLMWVIATG
jgi:hypothetical protein